tara:strand:+ start:133 stop:447 length:315 start_codon:yes stop_codon:yes gene_type:complete
MDLINSHITLSYDRYFIKIYKQKNYYIIATLGNSYDLQKSKSILEVAVYINNMINEYPIIDLLFYHNKNETSKNRKININKLVKSTNDKSININTLKKYINLLF